MCGIAGVLPAHGIPDVDLLLRMLARLHHRGPDGSGYYRDAGIALGHTRLSIVDVAGGAQPMCDADGSVWVSFNGEIFNYVELRDELRARGHRFRTASDTEVIVHAWKEWGPGAFERFNGQWALALWEPQPQRLTLCRDRLGVRPLYLARSSAGLSFASEVKALFADPTVDRSLDPAGLDEIFTFWSTVAPRTVFAAVEQLRPGHYLTIDADGEREAPYWQLEFPARGHEPVQDLTENTARLRDLVHTAARLRFERSDVPVGAYLSGGLDSSITASVVAGITRLPLHTFSLRFADADFDEGEYQRALISQLGTEHHEVVVGAGDIADIFPDVVLHAETPLLRSAPAPMFLLSRLVRDAGYKVVVTGEGADEVLAGYDIFREARAREFWLRNPDSPLRQQAVTLLYPWLARNPNAAPAFAREFFERGAGANDPAASHRPRWNSTSALKHMLAPEMRYDGDVAAALTQQLPPAAGEWDPLGRAQWFEATTLLPGYILSSQGDRMLMGNSVEGRFPFLDRDVVEFAAALPARQKLMGLDEKHILKRAFADLIPDAILRRPKQPYRAPDASAFFADGAVPDWLADVLAPATVAEAGVFQTRVVESLVAKCRRTEGFRMSNTDNMRALAVISTQLLHRLFVADGGRDRREPAQPMTIFDTLVPDRSTA